MTATPFNDILARARRAALSGNKLNLANAYAVVIATDPDLQALLATKAAQETARCLAELATTEDDSPGLPLFQPSREQLQPMPAAPQPRESAGSGRREPSSGSSGVPSEGSISSLGTIAPLVQDAASQQALDQVQASIRLSQRMKSLQRGTPSAPAPRPRRHRPKLASA